MTPLQFRPPLTGPLPADPAPPKDGRTIWVAPSSTTRKTRLRVLSMALTAMIWPGLAVPAGASTETDRACRRLVETVQALHLAGAGNNGTYVCEHQPEAAEPFVFALRWRGDGLPDEGSNLVGYYGVDTATGSIHTWDLGEDQPGEVLVTAPASNSLPSLRSPARHNRAEAPHHPP